MITEEESKIIKEAILQEHTNAAISENQRWKIAMIYIRQKRMERLNEKNKS